MPYISSSTLYFHIYYNISQLQHCDKTTENSALEKDKNWTIRDGFTIGLSFLKKGINFKTFKAHSHQCDALMPHTMFFLLRLTEKIEPYIFQ